MKTRKLIAMFLMLTVLVFAFAGCGKSPAPEQSGDEPGGNTGAKEEYAVIMSLHQLEFFDALKAGVNDAAKDLGADWYYAGPQDLSPEKVVEAIDQAVANKVTGIVLHGQFEETGSAVDNAIAAGVPVIIVNTDIPSDRLSFLGCEPYNAGFQMGETIAELIGYKGNVITSTWLGGGQPSALANQEGCEDALAQYPDIKIVAKVDDQADAGVAAAQIGAALQANPDVVGIVGMQAPSGMGAATAVREAGLTDKVQIVSRDRDSGTLELIEDGEIAASFAQNSYVEGYIATKWLHDYANGNLKVIQDYKGGGVNPLPLNVDSGSIIITKDNVEQFKAKYEYDK